jgi:protein gp37
MGADTRIEWADHTFNPWTGCQRVSPGCDHCYAEALAKRAPKTFGSWLPGGERKRTSEAYWRQPLVWDRKARGEGRRFRVFCASMADIMDKAAPIAWFVDALDLMRTTPRLIWLLLTKRPQMVRARLEAALAHLAQGFDRGDLLEWIAGWLHGQPPENVWLGTTAEDQREFQRRVPFLRRLPAVKRFLSCEPLLGEIDAACDLRSGDIHWVIAGGESGPKARPSHPDWFRSLRDQCQAAGVPFFFKQWGEYVPVGPVDRGSATDPHEYAWERVGKKRAGAVLDGREWREIPQ